MGQSGSEVGEHAIESLRLGQGLELGRVRACGWVGCHSRRQVYFMLAQDCSGLPSTKAGRNWHLDKPALAASSSRLKPELFSISDWITLPSTPTKKRKATVPSSSRRRDALGYSGFSHWLTFTPAAVRVGAGVVAREGAAAAGAVAAGAAAGAAAWGAAGAETVKPALDGVGVLTAGNSMAGAAGAEGAGCRGCAGAGLTTGGVGGGGAAAGGGGVSRGVSVSNSA
jgi:hypothetical protein